MNKKIKTQNVGLYSGAGLLHVPTNVESCTCLIVMWLTCFQHKHKINAHSFVIQKKSLLTYIVKMVVCLPQPRIPWCALFLCTALHNPHGVRAAYYVYWMHSVIRLLLCSHPVFHFICHLSVYNTLRFLAAF